MRRTAPHDARTTRRQERTSVRGLTPGFSICSGITERTLARGGLSGGIRAGQESSKPRSRSSLKLANPAALAIVGGSCATVGDCQSPFSPDTCGAVAASQNRSSEGLVGPGGWTPPGGDARCCQGTEDDHFSGLGLCGHGFRGTVRREADPGSRQITSGQDRPPRHRDREIDPSPQMIPSRDKGDSQPITWLCQPARDTPLPALRNC